jgi:hypothetical protein
MFLTIAAITLGLSAFYDGLSTVHFLKKPGYVEANPLLGPRPSTLRIFGEGSALIAGEILVAFLISHFNHDAGLVMGVGGFVQSAAHLYFGTRNWRL